MAGFKVFIVFVLMTLLSCENKNQNNISQKEFFELVEMGGIKNAKLVNRERVEFNVTSEGCKCLGKHCDEDEVYILNVYNMNKFMKKKQSIDKNLKNIGRTPISILVVEDL